MTQNVRRAIATALFLLVLNPNILAADQTEGEEPVIDVMGKVVDHDYLEILSFKVYLPRILFVGTTPHLYLSTNSMLDSGEFVETEAGLIRADGIPVSLDMSITSHLMYVWFGIILTILISLWAAARYKKGIGSQTEPKGTSQNLFEVFFVFVRDDIAKEYIPDSKYVKFVPYLFSVFMAITFMNLFGLLPWGVSATADLTVTATLAGFTFFLTQFNGSKDHWQHVFWFPGVHPLMRVILTPVEVLGLFTKPFALAIRLFANMLSGKIMIVCVLGLIFIFAEIFGTVAGYGTGIFAVVLTSLLYILKAFIALLQAYIFTLLSAVFIGMAAEEHHHDHESAVTTETEVHI